MLEKQQIIKTIISIETLLNRGFEKVSMNGLFISESVLRIFEGRLKKLISLLEEDSPTTKNSTSNFASNFFRFFERVLENPNSLEAIDKLIIDLKIYLGDQNHKKLARFCIAFYILQRYEAISYKTNVDGELYIKDVSKAISNKKNQLSLEVNYDVVVNKSLFGILKIGFENIPEFVYSFEILNLDTSRPPFLVHAFSFLAPTIKAISIQRKHHLKFDLENYRQILANLSANIKHLNLTEMSINLHVNFSLKKKAEMTRYGKGMLETFHRLPKSITFLTLCLERASSLFMAVSESSPLPSNISGLAISINHYGNEEDRIYKGLTDIFEMMPDSIHHLQLRIDVGITFKKQAEFINIIKIIPAHIYQCELVIDDPRNIFVSVEKINETITERIQENLKNRPISSLKELTLHFIAGQRRTSIDKANGEVSFITHDDLTFTKQLPTHLIEEIESYISPNAESKSNGM